MLTLPLGGNDTAEFHWQGSFKNWANTEIPRFLVHIFILEKWKVLLYTI